MVFASLNSGLLARKGQARPAMRPQGYGVGQGTPDDLGWNDMGHDIPRPVGVRLPSDLSGGPAEVPAVVRQQDEIARKLAPQPAAETVAEPEEAPAPEAVVAAVEPVSVEPALAEAAPAPAVEAKRPRKVRSAKPGMATIKAASHAIGRKAAFTLRLDAERHLRLRLACAVQNRSAQQLVTDALDHLLSGLPDVERMAVSLPAVEQVDLKGSDR